MGYSPAPIPAACPDCGFVVCKCYEDEILDTDAIEYDPLSTEPDSDFDKEPFVDELDLSNDGYEMFEMNEAFDLWRD